MAGSTPILKKIEIAIRSKINSNFSDTGKARLIDKPEKLFSGPIKVLLLRQDRLGDVLISVPFLKILRSALPEARIDILLSHRNIGGKRAVEKYVNNIFLYDRDLKKKLKLVLRLRANKYDLIVDLFDTVSTTSSLIVKWAGARQSLGLNKDNAGIYDFFVPMPDKQTVHVVERIASLLLPFGLQASPGELVMEYPVTSEEKSDAFKKMKWLDHESLKIGLNLSGSDRTKYWSTGNHINFLNWLAKEYPKTEAAIFHTPDYNTEAEIIEKQTGTINAPQAASFHEYACLLSTCDIIITPDTSAVHLAASWQKPCIALYKTDTGGTGGMPWIPYNSPYISIVAESTTIESINVEDVFEAFKKIIPKSYVSY